MITYFALCGAPEAGKSKVQRILSDAFNIVPVDDSRCLRDAAKILYGLSEDDVTTQTGKRRILDLGGRRLTVREVMGELGQYLERGDPLHIPKMARRDAAERHPGRQVSLGSLRMDQGLVFQDEASLVVEVRRPGFHPKREFDYYNKDLAKVVINNNYDPENPIASNEELTREVMEKLSPFIGSQSFQKIA
jgi:hypothetical protein